MTEDEAKTKWCPMARSGDPDRIGANRYGHGYGETAGTVTYGCIGSSCMMWRATKQDVETGRTPNLMGTEDVSFETVHGGYCGLAGKP